MKKFMAVVVAIGVAFAFSAMAGEQKSDVKVTKEAGTTKVDVKEKAGTTATKVDVQKTGTTVTGDVVQKTPAGANVVKDTVQFEKYDAQGDYIYVLKDNKEVRAKHTLNDSMKKDMLTLKKGDKIEVTSTRMLSPTEVATITNLQKIGSSPAVKEAIQKATEPAKTK